jgi:hypothetical protein
MNVYNMNAATKRVHKRSQDRIRVELERLLQQSSQLTKHEPQTNSRRGYS